MNVDELELETETRQRVERWIEESQYLLGRIIPGIIQERDRLRVRAQTAEDACEQLGREAANLRKEVSELHLEVQSLRNELAEIGQAAGAVIEHLTQSMQPMQQIQQKLQQNKLLEAKPYAVAVS